MNSKKPFVYLYPSVYKFIYKTHNFLRGEILKPGTPASIITTILAIAFYFKINNGAKSITAICTLTTIVAFILISKLLGFLIVHLLKNIGGKFTFSGEFVNVKDEAPVELKPITIDKNMLVFANEYLADNAATLNVRAFRRTAWHTSYDDKFKRNLSHIQRNKYSILLIKSKVEGLYVGYTHIFPVTKNTWENYKAGRLGDNAFSYNRIVSDNPRANTGDPYGLIIFSIAMVERYTDCSNSKNYRLCVGSVLEQATVYHVKKHLEVSFGKTKEPVPVLLQTENQTHYNFLKRCALSTDNISKDGARIIEFEIANNNS